MQRLPEIELSLENPITVTARASTFSADTRHLLAVVLLCNIDEPMPPPVGHSVIRTTRRRHTHAVQGHGLRHTRI